MKRVFAGILVLSCILVCANDLYADTVKLKNGRQITGRIKEVTDTSVTLFMGPGTVGFQLSQVESINDLTVEEAKSKLSTTEAFVTHDKDKAMEASFKEGINFVSKTRKLEFKKIPEMKFVTKDEIKANLKKSIEESYSKEKLDNEAKLLSKLGLITGTDNYGKEVTDLFTEQVAGYYDDKDKKIYVSDQAIDEIRPGLPSMTVMHEQVHALQDQYFDLQGIHKRLETDNADQALASKAVVEGEATVLMYDAFFRSMKGFGIMPQDADQQIDLRSFVIDSMLAYSKRMKSGDNKPAIFMESLFFPYVYGGSFIQYTVNNKGWEAVGAIFNDMPASSEQIMHPEKYYITRDEPKKVAFGDVQKLLGPEWVRLDSNTFGEFSFYLIGKKFIDELSAKMMSEGWGGDHYEYYEDSTTKKTLLITVSKWDTERDAEEFFSLYKNVLEKKYSNLNAIKSEVNLLQWKNGEENIFMSKNKDTVSVVEGALDSQMVGLIELFAK